MSLNDKLLKAAAVDSGITPSEHFGVVLYQGDGGSSHSINGGKYGGAAYFNGSNGKIDIGTLGNIFINNFSFSLWFNLNTIASSGIATLFTTFEDYYCYAFIRDSDKKVEVRVENASTGYAIKSTSTFGTYGVWHHLAVTKSSSDGLKIYINGSLENTDATATVDLRTMNGDNLIGAYNSAGTTQYYLEGKIDQLRIFSKSLSSSEVSTLYAETVDTVASLDPLSEDTTDTLQVFGDTSCLALYKFENDETDVSGNYNGTGTSIQYAAGRYGQSAVFNGSSSVITLPSALSDGSTTDASCISFWFFTGAEITSSTTNNEIMNFAQSSSNFGKIALGSTTGNFGSETISVTSDVTDQYTYSKTNIPAGWNHVVVQWNSSNTKWDIYVNNVAHTTYTFGTNEQGKFALKFGQRSTFYYTGRLDQIRVFNKILSTSEIKTLYEENSLVASYRFEGNSNDDRRNNDGTDSNVTYEFGLNFTPDVVWLKNRDTARSHLLVDSSRGRAKNIYPNSTSAETTSNAGNDFVSFDTGGFTVGTTQQAYANDSGDEYVAWCWKAGGGTTTTNNDGELTVNVQANQDAGFSIITFDGVTDPGEDRSFGHGLSKEPEFIWMKRRNASQHNAVFAKIDGTWEYFDGTSSTDGGGDYSAYIATTSTVIDIHDAAEWFADPSSEYVYWCWHSVENYSKIGTYEGTGSATDRPIIETGFEPAFVMIKNVTNSGSSGSWMIHDNKRNTVNPRDKYLRADSTNAEGTFAEYGLDFLSNGFQVGPTTAYHWNTNGDTYLYMAFAADPDTETPTLANSFGIRTYTGTGANQSIEGLNFKPGFVWLKGRTRAEDSGLFDIVRGTNEWLRSSTTAAQNNFSGDYGVLSFDDDGFSIGTGSAINNNNDTFIGWAWAADDNEPTIFGGAAKAVYKFEDNVNDVTGNFNGSATSITYNSSGKYNKSAVFNGTNSRITNTSSSISTTFSSTSITISAWFKFSATLASGRTYMVVLQGGGYQEYVGVYLESNKVGVIVGNFTQDYRLGSVDVNDGNWHHIVLTRSSTSFSDLKGYLDGSPMSESATGNAGGGTLTFNTISMGYNSSISSNYFNGELDQVRIYRGAITDVQVAELYAETVSDNDDLFFGGPPEIQISANANAGFSIVKYTGIGANLQVPHGLSSAPELLIIKGLETTNDWAVLHKDGGDGDFLQLNSDSPESGAGSIFGSTFTRPTATYFTVGNTGETGTADKQYIAYCFHSVSAYSKIGSYTGVTTGVTVTVGFRPDFLLIKSNSNTEHWAILDTVRGTGKVLNPNRSNAESDSTLNTFTVSDTGFSFPHQDTADAMLNENGYTYIYAAFKIN